MKNMNDMNVVFIVPTGIGAEIGGHSGDATTSAKLVASVCNRLVVHPNVVNAADINEMTDNMLYVEGSILDRFLEGEFGLEETCGNKILVAVNKVTPEIVNAVSAARTTLGADIEIIELNVPIEMIAMMELDKRAGGYLDSGYIYQAIKQLDPYDFDVLVVNTPITTNDESVLNYLQGDGGVNVWGGIEAILSKEMSAGLNRPVIHSPVEIDGVFKTFNEVVDPRKGAEMVSVCYLHCCLKGGHVAPRMSNKPTSLWNTNIDFLITPINVFGRPHKACVKANIPIIAIEENTTVLNDDMPPSVIVVKNYLEACGVICAKKARLTLDSLQRPLKPTHISC